MGAGVIPFAQHKKNLYFLFQTVFEGRKTGFLNDFGGGNDVGETYQQTAIREFVEETETLFFAQDHEEIQTAHRHPARVKHQQQIVTQYFEQTLREHPNWWCQRAPGNKIPGKDWRTYFIEFDYRDVDALNQEWEKEAHHKQRFKKRRALHWVSVDELLTIYQHQPHKLWKRVRQLVDAEQMIKSIQQEKMT